ncbi:Netrin-1 [Acromyrmex echinatior]|uniref:Netrin-1 n=1 Tax=Acromyrmex echinatior TaxID=103372 RepID=F4WCE9_ACREC|nr:Netrin-1 [Acromyrmex echinatior]
MPVLMFSLALKVSRLKREFVKFIFKPRARSCAWHSPSAKENTVTLRKINLRPLLGTTSPGKNPHTIGVVKLIGHDPSPWRKANSIPVLRTTGSMVSRNRRKEKSCAQPPPIQFYSLDRAILGRITDRHKKSDSSQTGTSVSGTSWIRFTLNVDFIYKKNPNSRIRRGDVSLYVHSADLACRCPKIKPNKSYLILGQESDGGGQGGLTVTQRSIVIEWRDEWHRRMRRFQRRARSCH